MAQHNNLPIPADGATVVDTLTELGITPTAQRVQIAAIVLAEKQHLSAEQILLRLGQIGAAVSKATVYNTMGLFIEHGLVRQVIVDSTKVFYDSNVAAHHHFYNIDDGTLTDFNVEKMPANQFPDPPAGTQTEGVDIVIRIRNSN